MWRIAKSIMEDNEDTFVSHISYPGLLKILMEMLEFNIILKDVFITSYGWYTGGDEPLTFKGNAP
jgi:hypothetical protein